MKVLDHEMVSSIEGNEKLTSTGLTLEHLMMHVSCELD
jgi:hypothetical protein